VFDVPLDGLYAWVGLATASAVLLAAATGLPTTPPPDAAGVADTVDRTAVTAYGATAEHPVDATEIELTPNGIGLRNDAGTTHATFAYGPVTPVLPGTTIEAVLDGVPPERAFGTAAAFERAVERARARESEWRPVDGPIRVRHVVGEGYDVTLVG